MERRLADEFVGVYPVSKTLRFELKPIGRTLEHIEKDGIIDTDVIRRENYIKVKSYIDEYHKAFIQRMLEQTKLEGLNEYSILYSKGKRTEKEEKKIIECQAILRKQISKTLKEAPEFKTIDKKELIKRDLLNFFEDDKKKTKIIKEFSEFTTYFTGFHENRLNMYSDEPKSGTIAYRVVHQNLPKYIDNIKIYNTITSTSIKAQLTDLNTKLKELYDGFGSIGDYFTIDGFNKLINQNGIDRYNTILGGYSTEGGEKVQGLNELINLYNQKNRMHLPKLKLLFKQILSDRGSISFIPEQFESDVEVFDAIDKMYQVLREEILENEENMTVTKLFSDLSLYNLHGIFVKNDNSISMISQALFGTWSEIRTAISHEYEATVPIGRMSREKYDEKEKKELAKVKCYSIGQLNAILERDHSEAAVEKFFTQKIAESLDTINNQHQEFLKIERNGYESGQSLKRNDSDISRIKKFLDSLKNLQALIKPLTGGTEEANKDETFYGDFVRIWEMLDIITPLYNKVRNYVTGKPYSTEKVKLNFGKSTLLNGWDKNKEKDNLGIILIKDGNYYLGIMNRNNKTCIEEAPRAITDNVYKKMNYKLLPGPNKMFPKVFFSRSGREEFAPSAELLAKYNEGTYKKGKKNDKFNLDDCHELIDFFKASIEKHKDWSQFEFRFSDTKSYTNIADFYREVSNQGYRMTFNDIDVNYIKSIVDEGKLYLFQIYNKDFSEYSKGTPNLHTMYWKALFMPENLKDVVYKLNGEAEVFYRKASIRQEDIITHTAGSRILNKDPLNQKKDSLFTYDIVKDRRYTCDKFLFHVPITINFKAGGELHMNQRVNRAIHDAEDMHIIGIDRGERNLLYISVIDMKGKIVKQMSLNEILSYDKNNKLHRRDFHQLLTKREKDNLSARQNWTTINTIKELKEGYLSQVIHVITDLIIRYNAIVVLEDLNFGFKRGRQKFERQVYQKFEKMLIDKLNLYVDKHRAPGEYGGVLKAYQLTAKFTSFQTLGKQSGFLFYVPAWNTSKIDPTTGFSNLFNTRYESVEKAKAFIRDMNRIWYDEETKAYAFSFDYSRFTYKAEGSRKEWTIYSYGKRIDHFRNPAKNNEWDVNYLDMTAEFTSLLSDYAVSKDGWDLREALLDIRQADFYKRFMKLMALTLQMRNSDEKLGIDEIVSPVKNTSGTFFVTGIDPCQPADADANGAYNIAKKGLWAVRKIKETEKDEISDIKLVLSNKEWMQFAQENTL